MSDYFRAWETTSVRADFLVADVVLRNPPVGLNHLLSRKNRVIFDF
jgi:hypothetical protein